ncbi:MAG: acyltransferase [Candidatus Caenarcaniphilales bacterium]|nr:acyltransferase [Candidatus Caenarcaniphilales bacterium]
MSENNKIVSLQIIRGLAAFSVLINHNCMDLYLRNHPTIFGKAELGTIGVPLFFLLSGFVLLYSITKSAKYMVNPSLFMLKRTARIVPLYWMLTGLTALLLLFLPSLFKSEHSLTLVTFIKSLFFLQREPLLGVGWTLNYEMFFYLVLFISLLITRKFFVWVSAGLLFLCWLLGKTGINLFFFSDWLLYFLAGILIFALTERKPKLLQKLREGRFVLTSVNLLLLGFYFWKPVTMPLLGIGLFLSSLSIKGESKNSILKSFTKSFIFLGEISYSLYLSHFFSISAVDKLGLYFKLNSYLILVLGITVSIGTAYLVYKFIEYPSMKFLYKLIDGVKKQEEISSSANNKSVHV